MAGLRRSRQETNTALHRRTNTVGKSTYLKSLVWAGSSGQEVEWSTVGLVTGIKWGVTVQCAKSYSSSGRKL